jgi:long-subunit acyl-CoA synthetase (AMP-forming)
MATAAIVQAHIRAPATADSVVDEWFSTDDIGWVDDDGYFCLVARENI